jgi:DNA-binding NarL/FixJ family response regulator
MGVMANIKMLLVDDHEIVRDGLKTLIESHHGVDIVDEAENGLAALEACKNHEIDLIIMDINMPEMDGIQATRSIKEQFPDIKILALTMSDNDVHIRKMIEAGASGYILKNAGREELKKAIEALMNDQHYFSDTATQSVMMELVRNKGKTKSGALVQITEREMEVLELIVREHTNQEIAEKLFISVRTVDAHRRNLLQKTGARNTAGLVRYALENKLFEQDS